MTRSLRCAALVFALAGFTLPVLAAEADPVVAKIDGKPVLRSEITKEIERLPPEAAQMPAQLLFPRVLDHMVATRLVSEAGYAKGVQNSPEVKEQLARLEKEIVAQTYIRQTVEPLITEDKIKAKYDESVKQFKTEDEVRARHILIKVRPDADTKAKADAEAKAKAILKEVQGGADFAKLAAEKSDDDGSAKQGGDLGYFPRGEMVKPFADAAFSMKKGQVSDKLVKTDFGYHIIKVEDARKSAPPSIDSVRDRIKNALGQEMTVKIVQEMVSKAKVERFNLDGTPIEAAKPEEKKPEEKK